MSRKSIGIGAWVPGTPSIRASPVVADRAARRLHVRDREGLGVRHADRGPASSPVAAATSPCSIANGPTPASMLPQFWLSVTSAWSTNTCRNR